MAVKRAYAYDDPGPIRTELQTREPLPRAYDPQTRTVRRGDRETRIRIAAIDAFIALLLAFAGGWLFAMWQQAHWLVTR